MGRVEGKVALVTGAAHGQGRSHAIRLAQEGADVIAIDIATQIASVPYAMGTLEELTQTAKEVQALDRRIVTKQVDVRDGVKLAAAVAEGVQQLGRLDIVSASAGICSFGTLESLTQEQWDDMIGVDLTGVWHTVRAAIPHLRNAGGGSVVLTSSGAGVRGFSNIGHYVAAKHGVLGLMKTFANELAVDNIRVNAILPGPISTTMVHNEASYELFAPDLEPHQRTREVIAERYRAMNRLPIPWLDPVDISNAVLWLSSDEARYVTGAEFAIDAGVLNKA
jgi:(+)-trans-carveol dehydrogenase